MASFHEVTGVSKTMAFVMAIVAIVTATVSVNVGIIIGKNMKSSNNNNSMKQTTTTTQGSNTVKHPFYYMERQLQQVTFDTPQQELDYVREQLRTYPALVDMVENIPTTVEELVGKETDTTALSEIRAIAWLIQQDTTLNVQSDVMTRFALAHLFYHTGGESNWNNTNNWLSTTEHHCTWYGVTCCKNFMFSPVCANVTISKPNDVTELDLYNNNLIGSIPSTLVLFQSVQSIFLSENWLTGTIPSVNVFQSMPKLLKLYLQHNTLTGTVPDVWNGVLGT